MKYSLSDSKGEKVSPEEAERIMKIVGTSAGQMEFPLEEYMSSRENNYPLFTYPELLDQFQLKQLFSQPLEKLIVRRQKREEYEANHSLSENRGENVEENAEENDEEEIEDEFDETDN